MNDAYLQTDRDNENYYVVQDAEDQRLDEQRYCLVDDLIDGIIDRNITLTDDVYMILARHFATFTESEMTEYRRIVGVPV